MLPTIKPESEMTPEEREKLGMHYNNKGWQLYQGQYEDNPNISQAKLWFEKAAKLGCSHAMVNLGIIHEEAQEYEQAYTCYLEAAYAGNKQGMYNVANMYHWGWGVDQNYQKAYEYFFQLYKEGYAGTAFYMGLYAENGFVAEKDYRKAVQYYEEGINEGDKYSAANLAKMFCDGVGVEVDYEKALEYYMLALVRGDDLAYAAIGHMYENGEGVKKDLKKAISYYQQGAEQKEENCIDALRRLSNEQ